MFRSSLCLLDIQNLNSVVANKAIQFGIDIMQMRGVKAEFVE